MFTVAIVGRPNVGRSTLFNRLRGFRKAIVGDEPGITRDRLECAVTWGGRTVRVVDTGGMVPDATEVIPVKILEQVEVAIGDANLLLLVVDGRAGLTSLDEQLVPLLRRSSRPVWVVVNKIDAAQLEPEVAPFYQLGFDEVFPISAEHGLGIGDLLEAATARACGPVTGAPAEETGAGEEISFAVVGRPNVGKSSLVNRLLGTERAIVSETPGTTRDSVDTSLEREGIRYRLIDTAGIRRKGRTEERTERVAAELARRSLRTARVALLVIDASEGVTKLDAAIGGYAFEAGCSVILVLNKWDLVCKIGTTVNDYTDAVRRRMKYLAFAPLVSVSARTGQRVSKLFDLVRRAHEARRFRVPTGELNNLFVRDVERELKAANPSARLGIQYITQAGVDPPRFVAFTAGRERLHFSTERFVINRLRDRFGFFAAPIRIDQRVKKPKSK